MVSFIRFPSRGSVLSPVTTIEFVASSRMELCSVPWKNFHSDCCISPDRKQRTFSILIDKDHTIFISRLRTVYPKYCTDVTGFSQDCGIEGVFDVEKHVEMRESTISPTSTEKPASMRMYRGSSTQKPPELIKRYTNSITTAN